MRLILSVLHYLGKMYVGDRQDLHLTFTQKRKRGATGRPLRALRSAGAMTILQSKK
jgi:hypothetical protein